MTIKQHGGIFGRNPTFNDVEAEALGIGGGRTGTVAGVEITTKFCVKDENNGVLAGFVHANNTTAASPAVIYACRSRGTLSSPVVIQDDDQLASIVVAGNDGTDLAIAARIDFEVDGTPGSNDMPGRIVFKTSPSGTQIPVDAMEIDSAQNVKLAFGNLAFASGNGIDFSATSGTGTSKLLDDYEEGAFTPVVSDAASGGNTATGTFNGYYTKIGDLVTCVISLVNIDTTGMTAGNDLHIQGLPFVAAPLNGVNRFQGALGAGGGVTFTGTLTSEISEPASYAKILETASGSNDYLIVSEVNSGTADIFTSITYKAT